MIVDVEATPAYRTQEVHSTRTMIERVEERFAIKTQRLIGDTAYGKFNNMYSWTRCKRELDRNSTDVSLINWRDRC
jgi:hypothetical protein